MLRKITIRPTGVQLITRRVLTVRGHVVPGRMVRRANSYGDSRSYHALIVGTVQKRGGRARRLRHFSASYYD